MNPKPRTYEPAGGDGLFFIISFAIIAVVAVEGLFIAFSSWWLMSAVLLLVIGAAIGVSAALVHLMDNDTAVPTHPYLAGYGLVGVRGGVKFDERSEIFVDFENVFDKSYRGISWGIDGPGRGVTVRYQYRF